MYTSKLSDARYRIIEKLGEGSEGSVFLALYLPTEEFRAVKKIRTGEDTAACRELEMMKHLRCEHLPRIIDVLREGTYTYLVMEHVRGTGMDKVLGQGRSVRQEQVMDAALQITDALCYLESRDPPVCHLDIKPSNLIRRPDGRIMLVDFGAAWKKKMPKAGMGTDGYAAPEQYDEQGTTDVRTDIYALGAVLYRMLTGRTCSRVLKGSQIPNCCGPLAAVIRKCMENRPEDRFQSAKALRKQLVQLRRKERRKELRVRVLGALAIALPAAAFGTSALPASMDLSKDPEWNYESLLEEAKVCSEAESRQYYMRAVFMNPGRGDAYLQYLEDAGADGEFSAGEDLFWRDLLHTVELGKDLTNEEELAADPDSYGQVALQTGLLYWYCSAGEDSRRIARGWFDKAVRAGECPGCSPGDEEGWLKSARLYKAMASALQLSAERSVRGSDPENMHRYWKVTEELMRRAPGLGSPLLELEFYREALSDLTFLCTDLETAGIDTGRQTRRIRSLLDGARNVSGSAAQMKQIEVLKAEAEDAGALALTAVGNREREEKNREEMG